MSMGCKKPRLPIEMFLLSGSPYPHPPLPPLPIAYVLKVYPHIKPPFLPTPWRGEEDKKTYKSENSKMLKS
jgi:hypothetical protein